MSLNVFYEQKMEDIYADSTDFRRRRLGCIPHLHRELELVLFYSGVTSAYADAAQYQLQPGDAFLTFPNQIHSYETFEKEKYIIIIIKPEVLPELKDLFQTTLPASAVIPHAMDNPRIRMLGEAVVSWKQDRNLTSAYSKPLLRGYLLALFSELLGQMQLKGVSAADSDTLRSIVTYCTGHFSGNLSLSVLEENLHLNKYYISHLFSNRLGLRFTDYVNSLRVSEACRFLLNSTHSITEISDLVGFNTLRTFNRAFIRQMHMTPSEYRRRHLTGNA